MPLLVINSFSISNKVAESKHSCCPAFLRELSAMAFQMYYCFLFVLGIILIECQVAGDWRFRFNLTQPEPEGKIEKSRIDAQSYQQK